MITFYNIFKGDELMVNIHTLDKDFYRSGEVAKLIGVATRTVQSYCIQGKMEDYMRNNRRLIPRDSLIKYLRENNLLDETDINRKDIIYARVSTHKQKNRGDLERQIQYIKDYVLYQNPKDLKIITDVSSGLNDNRKGLTKILDLVLDNKVDRIFVYYKDRLTRFGYNYIKLICDFHNTKIIIINKEIDEKSVSEELAEDIISIIHSFSGKLYGMRKKVHDDICKELEADEIDPC